MYSGICLFSRLACICFHPNEFKAFWISIVIKAQIPFFFLVCHVIEGSGGYRSVKTSNTEFIPFWVVSGRGGKKGAVDKCNTCGGSGMQVQIQQLAPGMIQQIQCMCGDCNGQGERISAKDRCKTCQGKKVNHFQFYVNS